MRIDSKITAITEADPVSASEFRTYAKAVNISGEDDLIDQQLQASVKWVENFIQKSINTNTFESVLWDFDYDRDFENGDLDYKLPYGPVTSVASVSGYDAVGTETALVSGTDYYLLPGGRLKIPSASSYDTYKVTYSAAMASVAITDNIKEAIIKLTAELYQHRGISVTGTIVSNLKSDIYSLLAGERDKVWL